MIFSLFFKHILKIFTFYLLLPCPHKRYTHLYLLEKAVCAVVLIISVGTSIWKAKHLLTYNTLATCRQRA